MYYLSCVGAHQRANPMAKLVVDTHGALSSVLVRRNAQPDYIDVLTRSLMEYT